MPLSQELKGVGINQSWVDVTASRALATTYTNSTGKPLFVVISAGMPATGYGKIKASINGGAAFDVGFFFNGAASTFGFAVLVVPVNATYAITFTYTVGSGATISQWSELR